MRIRLRALRLSAPEPLIGRGAVARSPFDGEHQAAWVLFNVPMGDREGFLDWFNTTWRAGEVALHNGDAGPRFRTWSEREPVTLFGAWLNAFSPDAARDVFTKLAGSFSHAASSEVDLIAADVSGDLAYTVHREITSTIVDGEPRDYVRPHPAGRRPGQPGVASNPGLSPRGW